MIKLKDILKESWASAGSSREAILTNNPIKLVFGEYYDGRHVDIIERLFPKEMEKLKARFGEMGYDENDFLFDAANLLAQQKDLLRVVVEGNTLYFNTDQHRPAGQKQLKFLKDYCIEHDMDLVQDMGMKKRPIDLDEGKG